VRRIPGLAGSKVVKQAANSRSAEVDIERSKAYCVPIFFNIMGIRIRDEGQEKDWICDEIIRGLQDIVDPETGARVVQQAYRASEYYYGPHADNIPDIIAIIDPQYGCSFHLSHYSSVVTKRAEISGPAKHRPEGIFIASGPGILAQPVALPNLDIEDVAPTALYLLGLPVPTDMDGRVLTEVIDPALADARPVKLGPPVGFWPAEGEVVFSEAVMSDEDEEVIRDRLRALGYFE
jgi:predicted AlkP superfamily phosphohydrolase/phosphomutase